MRKVTRHDQVAIIGKPFTAHFRFADVWRKRNGGWQVVFTEVTRLPATQPAP